MCSLYLEQDSFGRSWTTDKLLKDIIFMQVAKLFKYIDVHIDIQDGAKVGS